METNRLRQLSAIVETGGLREAARLLHISHSGLSKSMKALEHDLGVPILAPQGRGVVLTDAGKRVYATAKRVLAEVEQLESAARGESLTPRPLRIATFEIFSTYVLGELIERELKGRALLAREAVPGAIERALADDEVDLGLTYLPIPQPEIEYLRVTTLEMAIFGRASTFADTPLADLPFAAPAIRLSGTATALRGLDGWPDDRVPRSVPYAVDMLETALDLARRGLAVVFVPTFVVDLHNKTVAARYALERLSTPRQLDAASRHRDVLLVKRRSTEESRVVKKIARALREICRGSRG